MKIIMVGGARPNFMKLAPIGRAFKKRDQDYILVHTGQHYDEEMSDIFFHQLEIQKPSYHFGVGSNTHGKMTAEIINKFEELCFYEKPDLVVVVGDVNSTLACAVVTSKIKGITLAHVEAGARSFDRTMPEEVNRIITDVLSDYLFTISPEHSKHLINEGIGKSKIYLVGDVMIDSLIHFCSKDYGIKDIDVLITLHRQGNVDDRDTLQRILKAIELISDFGRIVFPIHPRTKKMITKFGFEKYLDNVEVTAPLGYFEFIKKMKNASVVLTDSGSIQVETTVLNIPCVTMRENTEREFTISEGTNVLVGSNINKIVGAVYLFLKNPPKSHLSAEHKKLFDGKASERIADILLGD